MRLRLILFILILTIISSVIFAVENTIDAHPPEMPLYNILVSIENSDEFPGFGVKLKQLMPQALKGFSWSNNHNDPAVDKFTARISGENVIFFLESYNGFERAMLYKVIYTDGKNSWSIDMEVSYKTETPAIKCLSGHDTNQIILSLIADKTFPVAFALDIDEAIASEIPIFKTEKLVTFEVKNNKLATKIIDPDTVSELKNTIQIRYDRTKRSSMFVTPIIGNILLKEYNYEVTYKDAVKIGEKLVVTAIADTEVEGLEPKLVWDIYEDSSWTRKELVMTEMYRLQLMPKKLQNIIVADKEVIFGSEFYGIDMRAWSDGSIVYNLRSHIWKGFEHIIYDCIVKQPVTGNSEVLTWKLEYYYDDKSFFTYDKVLNRTWYPIPDGVSKSAPVEQELRYYFDVDPVNDSLIFLRKGVPWQLILDK